MQRFSAGKKKRIITAGIAGALTVAIVSTALYRDSSEVLARPSLPGVEQIVNENSNKKPFKILEIVEDYEAARIGYTVAGEEPGYYDNNGVAALSDMASSAERKARYMNGTATDPSNKPTAAYSDLVGDGKAATYSKFSEEDDSAVPYDATTAGAKNYKIYGSFEANSGNTGLYDDNTNYSSDYRHVKRADDDDESKFNLTIDQVAKKVPGSDQTGLFYTHHIRLGDIDTVNVDTSKYYDIDSFFKLTAGDSWKYPFKVEGYTETYNPTIDDPAGSYTDPTNRTYYFYSQDYYAPNAAFAASVEKKDVNSTPDDETDDFNDYKMDPSTTPNDGDLVFEYDGSSKLTYVGYIKKDTDDVLKYYATDDTLLYPVELTSTQSLTDDDDATNDVIESFAELIIKQYTGGTTQYLCTVKTAGEDDDKYYISKITPNTNGKYQIYTGFDVINDPNFDPSDYGIADESAPEKNWYHQWYYKCGALDPYTYNSASTGAYDFKHDYSGDQVNNFYYKDGYVNAEWFKTQVLDVDSNNCPNICIDVITRTLGTVTEDDIAEADLVYFTYDAGNVSPYNSDIDYKAAKKLLERVTVGEDEVPLAVVLNMRCYVDGVLPNKILSNPCENVAYLMELLFMTDYASIRGFLGDTTWNIDATTKTNLYDLGQGYYNASMDISHVTRSVFINDDRGASRTDAVSVDFVTGYASDKISGVNISITAGTTTVKFNGFQDVEADINEELFYLEVAGKANSGFNPVVSKATTIRYILNYGNRRKVAKTEIRVLDIEPYFNPQIENSANPNTYLLANTVGGNKPTAIEKRDIFDKNWFTTNLSDTTSNDNKSLTVDGVGTKTFIGRIEDLNESYDLIYIGMDTAYLNTSLRDNNKTKRFLNNDNKVSSNDGKGLIYRHDGDRMYMYDSAAAGTINNTNHHGTAANNTYSLSGNDITPDKLYELENYVKAGYAVILSDYFFTYDSTGKIDGVNSINKTLLDENSYLYDFVKFCIEDKYLYKNVEIKKNLENATNTNIRTSDGRSVVAHRETFLKYLNISKLDVNVIETPPLYNPYDLKDIDDNLKNDYHQYIEMDGNGQYTLNFKVELTNDAATDTTNTSYDCLLYIDHDGDGRFEDVEKLDSLDIAKIDSSNNYVENVNIGSDGKYSLKTGTRYSITRAVPEGYFGLISWKLVFVENGRENDLIKVAVQDYSALRNMAGKQTIKVLQLTTGAAFTNGSPNNVDGTNLNLWNDGNIQRMYEQVQDFEITVDHASVRQFIDLNGFFQGTTDRFAKLCEYDIIVLGFSDAYIFPYLNNDNAQNERARQAVLAIREYMLSGRSILFTHDLTSPRIYDDATTRNITERFGVGQGVNNNSTAIIDGLGLGYLANAYLRDIQGMDRYGFTHRAGSELLALTNATEYKSVYDEKTQIEASNRVGFSDSLMAGYSGDRNTNGELSRYGAVRDWPGWQNIDNNRDDTYHFPERDIRQVARLNRGQITEYPFRIGDVEKNDEDGLYYSSEFIDVATTHNQWFQLNLETNYRDTNYDDDIVVWYTLSSKVDREPVTRSQYHRLNYKDARNDYYIYNKGNVTYTGAGHSMIADNKVSERKLFVNTLVASYNAGTHAPYAEYKNGSNTNSASITSRYIPYDISLNKSADEYGRGNGFLEDTVTVYFKTVNNNLQDNKMPLIAQYYIEVPTGGDITIGTGENKKHYKKVSPQSIEDCTTGGAVDSTKQILENGRVYKLEFRVSDLINATDINSKYQIKIYTRMRSRTKGEDTCEKDLADLNATGEIIALPASDSFKPLNINFTQLYDLK